MQRASVTVAARGETTAACLSLCRLIGCYDNDDKNDDGNNHGHRKRRRRRLWTLHTSEIRGCDPICLLTAYYLSYFVTRDTRSGVASILFVFFTFCIGYFFVIFCIVYLFAASLQCRFAHPQVRHSCCTGLSFHLFSFFFCVLLFCFSFYLPSLFTLFACSVCFFTLFVPLPRPNWE